MKKLKTRAEVIETRIRSIRRTSPEISPDTWTWSRLSYNPRSWVAVEVEAGQAHWVREIWIKWIKPAPFEIDTFTLEGSHRWACLLHLRCRKVV